MRREIAATFVTNDLVNRAGITFVPDLRARTGREAPEIARSYRIVREAFELPRYGPRSRRSTTGSRRGCRPKCCSTSRPSSSTAPAGCCAPVGSTLGREISRFAPVVEHLAEVVAELLPARERALLDQRAARLSAAGVPQSLAGRMPASSS